MSPVLAQLHPRMSGFLGPVQKPVPVYADASSEGQQALRAPLTALLSNALPEEVAAGWDLGPNDHGAELRRWTGNRT